MIWRVLVFTMITTSVAQAASPLRQPPYATIQLRRDIPANWASVNPILKAGEPGCEMTGLPQRCTAQKIGDGVTRWSSLPYVSGNKAFPNYSTLQTIGRGGNGGIAVDDVVAKGPKVDARHPSFTNLSGCIHAVSSTGGTILVSTPMAINNKTVPANVQIEIVQGGRLDPAIGKTLMLNTTPIASSGQQIFGGSGKVVFGVAPSAVYPQWWYSGTGSWAPAWQSAMDSGVHKISIPEGIYDFGTSSVTQQTAGAGLDGVAIVGLGTYHNTKIIYTGTGYAINYIGEGADAAASVSRFYMENIWITGNDNTSSAGALNISRSFVVELNRCQFSDFGKSGGKILNIRNTFNFLFHNSQISGSYPGTSAADGIILGSESPNAWNTSNVQIRNSLVQRTNIGVKVAQDANVFDNLSIDNTSFGSNNGHIYANSSTLYGVSLTNNHFEACESGTAVDLRNMSNVNITDNFFQNALTHIYLEDVDGFLIGRNKIQNPVDIPGDTAIKVNVVDGNSRGHISPNNINTGEITTPYNIHASARITSDTPSSTESAWSGFYASKAVLYGRGGFAHRYERDLYNQMWTAPDGATWLRLMLSNRDYAESTSVPVDGSPFAAGATVTQGAYVKNLSPSVSGAVASKYVIRGWVRITTGTGHVLNTDWVEDRGLTGQ